MLRNIYKICSNILNVLGVINTEYDGENVLVEAPYKKVDVILIVF